ncbi:ABC transporter permease [uncultured Draconibacterium sp.]|uniref:ABC transporter permease n=1 Tax=uncultured Draconibacterium sp. TaxID=1573823 RepID=UPI0032166A04
MIKNLLKTSLRSLKKQKGYTSINILGLAIGIACSLIIALFILHQLSYDQYHTKKDRIYRLILDGKIGEQEVLVSSTAAVIGPTIVTDFPEVESCLRLNTFGETIVKKEDKTFTIRDFAEADSTFFSFFSIPLLKGESKNVLNEPYSMVLSESTAKKIFGNENPINKTLKINTRNEPYRITGVMADFPENTHFKADILTSYMTNPRSRDPEWLNNSFETYLMLYENTNPEQVNARFSGMIKKYIGPRVQELFGVSLEDFFASGNRYNFHLQPLTKIHLDPTVEHEVKPATDPKYLWIFGSIAILIIVIASINFMNLSTAQASKRAKEVGIKKATGASRASLVTQFLSDSVLISFMALIVAIVIVLFALPAFNRLLGAEVELSLFSNWYTIPLLLVFSVSVGLLAGIYPAFYLSSFVPVKVLRGKVRDAMKNGKLRSVLVSFQFLISIVLIIGTMIMYRQLQYMLNKDVGFNKEQMLVIQQAGAIGDKVKTFKQELLKIPEISSVSASTAIPGHNNNNNGYMLEGNSDQTFLLQSNWVDYDFFKTYQIKLQDGRLFDQSFTSDEQACIVNAQTIKEYNLTDFSASRFIVIGDNNENIYLPIIGVTNDFHFRSLHNRITPYIIRFKDENQNYGYISIRFNNQSTIQTINEIETIWKKFASNNPMQYFFMDKDFNQMYRAERQNAQLSVLFAILGIFIAALGLFGLTSFTIEQRTKEVGVRKSLGASDSSIFYLISKEIIILVSIATLIAWPLVFFGANSWLQNYYYRVNLSVYEFVLGFVIAISIALLTISYRTIQSVRTNPALTLRYE